MTIKRINWKQNDSGSHVAFCGGLKVGWITRSLTNSEIYYPSLFNDRFKLKQQDYTDLNEAKEAFEKAFNEIVKSFLDI